jgi:hypothetical protein
MNVDAATQTLLTSPCASRECKALQKLAFPRTKADRTARVEKSGEEHAAVADQDGKSAREPESSIE